MSAFIRVFALLSLSFTGLYLTPSFFDYVLIGTIPAIYLYYKNYSTYSEFKYGMSYIAFLFDVIFWPGALFNQWTGYGK